MLQVNETHDPGLTSWVDSANFEFSDFPIQNLPFAVFSDHADHYRVGVGIGDYVLDLAAIESYLPKKLQPSSSPFGKPTLMPLMLLGPGFSSDLRRALFTLLRSDSKLAGKLRRHLYPIDQVNLAMPCQIGDFTDFYSSLYHATAVGKLFRPDNPLLPNYKWVPIAYHGRASSIGISGQKIRRPLGQIKLPEHDIPTYQPSAKLDFELEIGILIGSSNRLGDPVKIETAEDYVFGLCLLNDWSARDIQAWEYQPLGPFLSKSFASTISPWMITMEALVPFRAPYSRPKNDPEPLPYLTSPENKINGGLDISLEVSLQSHLMRKKGLPPQSLSHSNFCHSYWTIRQMIAHHTSNGCNLCAGDLLGTGTQSGPVLSEAGSLLELSQGGQQPLELETGEQRIFVEDGDIVKLTGWCEREGAKRIGFGSAVSTVISNHDR